MATGGLYGNNTSVSQAYFTWFIYIQSATAPSTPTGGTWTWATNTGVTPTGWSNSPSTQTSQVWVSSAIVSSQSTTITWSTPYPYGALNSGLLNDVFYENSNVVPVNYSIGQSAYISGVTVPVASPAIMNLVGHGFVADQQIHFTSTGTLPAGIVTDTVYYVISSGLTASTFQMSLTLAGTPIGVTTTGTGIHSVAKIKNAMTAGTASVATGITVTIPTGSTWVIV